MERLTKLYSSGALGIKGDIDDAIMRLSAIENILGDEYDLDYLQEVIKANKEGKLVNVPCRIGDDIWTVTGVAFPHISKNRCVEIKIKHETKSNKPHAIIYLHNGFCLLGDNFGTCNFLSKEEAEAEAMRRREHCDEHI